MITIKELIQKSKDDGSIAITIANYSQYKKVFKAIQQENVIKTPFFDEERFESSSTKYIIINHGLVFMRSATSKFNNYSYSDVNFLL